MNLKTESEAIVMKTVNYFLSPRNLCVFASILFLSQNALAGKLLYHVNGLAEADSDDNIRVKIANDADYNVDSVTLTAKCGKSVTSVKRRTNLFRGDYGIWYLKPNCRYTLSGKAVKLGNKKVKTSWVRITSKSEHCEARFRGSLRKRYTSFGMGCK